jgi:hypothetical protein
MKNFLVFSVLTVAITLWSLAIVAGVTDRKEDP